jgi:hypothetical protein
MLAFGIIYHLLGVTFDDGDYPKLSESFAGMLQIFRNSAGDI